MAKVDEDKLIVSSNWNGVVYAAHASDGEKFGSATGATDAEAREAAVADLEKNASKDAPEQGGTHSTQEHDAEQAAAVRAGKTGDKGKSSS